MQQGDIVRFLNTTGGGRVTRIEGNLAYVEDEDGFETPVLLRECVVVGHEQEKKAAPAAAAPKATPQAPAPLPQAAPVPEEPLDIEETADGDKLNVVLAYEPRDIKAPTTCAVATYLVNDSNYYLSFVYLTRASAAGEWTCRYAGTVEPNIQLLLGELDRSQLTDMDLVRLDLVAYKLGKPFEAKAPLSVTLPLDTSKFFKLHCFRDNIYFDNPVIALTFVRDDEPQREQRVDTERLAAALNAKKAADRRRPVQKKRPEAKPRDGIIVVDLHIQELVDNTHGLSAADMLNLQVDEFRRVMDANLRNKGRRIVFIHGKGEGVLRNALLKELRHRYKGHDVQDASFREYGFGATQVTIR